MYQSCKRKQLILQIIQKLRKLCNKNKIYVRNLLIQEPDLNLYVQIIYYKSIRFSYIFKFQYVKIYSDNLKESIP